MKKYIYIAFVIALFACDNQSHIIGGELSKSQLSVNSMTFLETHHQLDTAALLFNLAGYEAEINSTSTVFVPNNLTLKRFISEQMSFLAATSEDQEFSVEDISIDTLQAYLASYIVPDQIILRDDLDENGQIYQTLNGDERLITLEESEDYSGQLLHRPKYVYFYTKQDEWDESPGRGNDFADIVRTSNLQSTNGAIHVLQGTAILRKKESN